MLLGIRCGGRLFGRFDELVIDRVTPFLLASDPDVMCAAATLIRAVVVMTDRPVRLAGVEVALETLVALYRAGLSTHACAATSDNIL